MTRPDLEALARKWIRSPATALTTEICATEQDVLDLVHRVAAAERARWSAKVRERAGRIRVLNRARFDAASICDEIADELEAEA